MHVLMNETTGAHATAIDALHSRGHRVHACHDESAGVCRTQTGQECPLDLAPIDVVVGLRTDPSSQPSALDAVRCGLRRRLPVVMSDERLVEAVEAVAAAPLMEHSSAARECLEKSLESAGIAFDRADAKVRRLHGALVVDLKAEPPLGQSASLRSAMAVYRRLRELDPWARSIDIRSDAGGQRPAQSAQTSPS